MTESKQVQEWQAQAYERGYEEGRAVGELIGRIHVCEHVLNQPISSREFLRQMPHDELAHYRSQSRPTGEL